eukprot:CAMPEP_0203737098 /NCGR_PEP_ID=MMETSP0092-20131115/37953_1 /ASSEMBLY_ACC=CAM_ASM_001090 /TAXON_ID=426623 /ORGANISM="Chaetoceros affinis, Strain CCMP159" /LENGTH=110 /DNA_ID=CAMNT_0050622267 /DNA_START=63 /DNA_END=392 /DNA_ORIENTATION=+
MIGSQTGRVVQTTPWESSQHKRLSYFHQHKNVLIITIDLFEKVSTTNDFIDKSKGEGGEGTVTATVRGDHLVWLESVLKVASENRSSIKHLIVQAHIPVLEPVRKANSSG